jgi:hypothetical protein
MHEFRQISEENRGTSLLIFLCKIRTAPIKRIIKNAQQGAKEGRGKEAAAPLSSAVVEDASRLDNAADEENPLVIRRKAPHNQRIEQTPFGRSSSAAFCGVNYETMARASLFR